MPKTKTEEAEETSPPEGGETTGPEEEVTIDREALAEAIRDVLPDVLSSKTTDGEGQSPPPPPAGGGTARQQERSVEEVVRSELARVNADKEIDERITKVEKAVEKPPSNLRRITKWVWGSDE